MVFVYLKLRENSPTFSSDLFKDRLVAEFALGLLFLVFLLQFLNYGLETYKWKITLQEYSVGSFSYLFKAVYAGNAIAIFTPDRLGNFLGRMVLAKDIPKKIITLSTLYGNLAQLLTTVVFALISSCLVLLTVTDIRFDFSPFALGLFLVVTFALGWAFFSPERLLGLLTKIKWIKNRWREWGDHASIKMKLSLTILFMAILRYLVFVVQYFLVFKALQVPLSGLHTFLFCGLLYGITTFIPSPFMGNLGIREAVSISLLVSLDSDLLVLTASLIIWMINVAFPAILGSLIINFSRRKK